MTAPRPFLCIEGLRTLRGGSVDLQVNRGECVCILGKSGSGKSVFLRLIADLDVGEGSVTLDGTQRNGLSGPAWRRRVIYQAAEPAWWAATVAEHFLPDSLDRVSSLLPEAGLAEDVMRADVARLSTGERQRLALLRSLQRKPAVLLLDEPTASLDHATTLAIEGLLQREVAAGLSILMVTHSREQAGRIGHRSFEMTDTGLRPA